MRISREGLTEKIGSIYKLCNIAARRAGELNLGMKDLVDASPKEKITTVALREIAEGKVGIKKEGKNKERSGS